MEFFSVTHNVQIAIIGIYAFLSAFTIAVIFKKYFTERQRLYEFKPQNKVFLDNYPALNSCNYRKQTYFLRLCRTYKLSCA